MFTAILLHAPGILHSFAVFSYLPVRAFGPLAANVGCGGVAATNTNTDQIRGVVQAIVNALTSIGAVVCALGIAVGGIMRATSFGNERRISDSNTAITCAVVGLVVVLLAQGLSSWINTLVKATCAFHPLGLPGVF